MKAKQRIILGVKNSYVYSMYSHGSSPVRYPGWGCYRQNHNKHQKRQGWYITVKHIQNTPGSVYFNNLYLEEGIHYPDWMSRLHLSSLWLLFIIIIEHNSLNKASQYRRKCDIQVAVIFGISVDFTENMKPHTNNYSTN